MSGHRNGGLPGVLIFDLPVHQDDRGRFVKTFQTPWLAQLGIEMNIREEFFSISAEDVLRGMHFQTPPADHQKIVTCTSGRVLDVLLDLRPGETYGQSWSIELDGDRPQSMLIPRGVAHGFLSMTEDSCMVYKVDHEHSPDHDQGIAWDSFGFDWPIDAASVRLSERDQSHPRLATWSTPF